MEALGKFALYLIDITWGCIISTGDNLTMTKGTMHIIDKGEKKERS